jgi:hypothetical protein
MKYEHPRDISIWCEKSEERVLHTIDTILDKTDIKNKEAKKLLTEATKILKEIEELKLEAQAKL